MDKTKAKRIVEILYKEYPEAKTSLNYRHPMDLLVATILSAQCTDARVNIVTKELFKKYKTPKEYANANLKTFEQEIKSTGFYRNKAKNIILAAKIIQQKHKGIIPLSMDELIALPGIGRKTANVIISNVTGKHEGIVVDTHVKRLSYRIGFTENKQPEKIEKDLVNLFEKKDWGFLSHALIFHGRKICTARKTHCEKCILNKQCRSAFKV